MHAGLIDYVAPVVREIRNKRLQARQSRMDVAIDCADRRYLHSAIPIVHDSRNETAAT
jgi:hypothetical protein